MRWSYNDTLNDVASRFLRTKLLADPSQAHPASGQDGKIVTSTHLRTSIIRIAKRDYNMCRSRSDERRARKSKIAQTSAAATKFLT